MRLREVGNAAARRDHVGPFLHLDTEIAFPVGLRGPGHPARESAEHHRRCAARELQALEDLADHPDARIVGAVARHQEDPGIGADVDRERHLHVREDYGVVERDQAMVGHRAESVSARPDVNPSRCSATSACERATRQVPGNPMRWCRAVLLALAANGVAAADPLHDALSRLQERYDGTRTFKAMFTQTVESPTLAGALESHGTVAFEKPNRMRWDYDPPDRQTIVGDGETLWIYQPDDKQVIRAPITEAIQASTPVTFLGGLGHLDREFDAVLDRDERDRWVLRLTPKKDKGIGTLTLAVRKSDAAVEEAKVRDPLGTTTRIRFDREQRNVKLDPATFRFIPPPGVDVIRPPAS